jgi:hypothetical protein
VGTPPRRPVHPALFFLLLWLAVAAVSITAHLLDGVP